MEIETLRMIERVIIAIGGVVSILAGYHLFKIAGITSNSSGAFKSPFLNISMTRIGPGVFFAFFGACVLISGLNSKMSFDRSVDTLAKKEAPLVHLLVSAINDLPDGDTKRNLSAITTQLASLVVEARADGAGLVSRSGGWVAR